MKLSLRMQTIANYLKEGELVADIGTDHAQIPIYLIKQGISNYVVGADLNSGPIEAAAQNVKMAGLQDKIDLRIGDGLSVLSPGEVQTVVIAGIGGGTMVEILNREPEVVEKLSKLILQPMNDENSIRQWVNDNRWYISGEELISEEGRIYTVIKVEKGDGNQLTKDEISFGPKLLEKKHPLLRIKLGKELEHTKRILSQIQEHASDGAKDKEKKLIEEIQAMEGVLKWL